MKGLTDRVAVVSGAANGLLPVKKA